MRKAAKSMAAFYHPEPGHLNVCFHPKRTSAAADCGMKVARKAGASQKPSPWRERVG
jgi:hypothetical protein